MVLNKIDEGSSVWDGNMIDKMRDFKGYACNNWMNIPLKSQLWKICVKYLNECLVTGKSNDYSLQLTLCQSIADIEFDNIVMGRAKSEIMKENKKYNSGILGEWFNKLKGDIEDHKSLHQ